MPRLVEPVLKWVVRKQWRGYNGGMIKAVFVEKKDAQWYARFRDQQEDLTKVQHVIERKRV